MAELNYNAITALTRKKYIPKLVDNFFKSNPLLAYLKDRQKTYDGGHTIVQPLIYGGLGGITSYAGYDQLVYDTETPITAAEFKPKNIAAPIIFSKDEELKCQGDDSVIELLESKVQIAEMTLKQKFTSQLYGDGTGNSSKDIDGLGALLATTGSYGGIDRAAYAWWQPYISHNSASLRALTEDLMLTTYLNVSDGDDAPDLILTGLNGWKQYYALVKGRITIYTDSVKKALGLGFQTLEFQGKPVMMDANIDDAATCKFYFLNTKYLQLRPHKAANFSPTKWRPDDSRIAQKQEILWTGNLTSSNNRRQGMLTDINPSGVSL